MGEKIISLRSKRLIYEPLTNMYGVDMLKLWSNPKVVKYMFCPLKESVSECNEWIELLLRSYPETNTYIVKFKDKVIGIAGAPKWEEDKDEYGLHYQIAEEYWHNGFGVEVAETLMNHTFMNLKAETMDTYVVTQNKSSINVLKRIGMQCIETRYGEFKKEGNIYNEYHYMMTRKQWNDKVILSK